MGICLTLNTATDRCQPVDLGGRLGGGIDQGLQPGDRLIIHLDVDRGITISRPAGRRRAEEQRTRLLGRIERRR